MKISAICPTYRRPELLEEALFSFLGQDYTGEKELIILNDEPTQKLVFNHPQVRVQNMPTRAPDLPTKYNFAASLATGDLILPWDDDDIYLPARLSTIADNQRAGVWYSDHLFTDHQEDRLTLAEGRVHCNHAFAPRLLIRFGAYRDHAKLSFDFVLMNQLRGTNRKPPPETAPTYIHRKKTTNAPNHSLLYQRDISRQYQRHAELSADFTPGEIQLVPRWSRDWQARAQQALDKPPIPLHQADAAYKPQTTTPAAPP